MEHLGTYTLETKNLLLKRFEYEHIDSMLKNFIADENIQKMYSEPTYKTPEEVKALLDKYISSYSSLDYYRYAIIDKESLECIGLIAFFLVDTKNQFAEIEYCIGSNYQRRGYATEATKRLIDFGFNNIKLHKIQICCKSINIASRRVIEKCGFTYEGTLRDYFLLDGKYVGREYFSILESEYFNK